jgi:hypothetical protein
VVVAIRRHHALIVSNRQSRCHVDALPAACVNVTVLLMYTVARMLQFVGLTIPLLSIFAQLNQQITLSQMLGFLAMSMGIFALGYLLQRYSGGPS